MVLATDLFHMMDPSGAPQNVNFDEPVATFDARYMLAGAAAPVDAEYVVLALNGVLTNERVLIGTANQVIVTDGGAGGNVTLSTPQDIDVAAVPEFDGMTISSADGIDYNPGSDIDTDLITVGVTGAPTMIWDESEDSFVFDRQVRLIINTATLNAGIDVENTVDEAGDTSAEVIKLTINNVGAGKVDPKLILINSEAIQWEWRTLADSEGMSFSKNASGGSELQIRSAAALSFADAELRFASPAFVVEMNTHDVGIGTGGPSAQLHVDQSSTTGAQPVLKLDQADISEPMMAFLTTIGVGNTIEAIGAKTLTTTHFLKVTIPGGLTRYIPIGTIA